MTGVKNPALLIGSTILVTGVNGFIGSHVADQLLKAGYRVRGTVRDIKKANWAQVLFGESYGDGKFELVEIKDLETEGAFDKALEGSTYLMSSLSLPIMRADICSVSRRYWTCAYRFYSHIQS
jgi:uncharacterized protein YbjT (DUF2867 family)